MQQTKFLFTEWRNVTSGLYWCFYPISWELLALCNLRVQCNTQVAVQLTSIRKQFMLLLKILLWWYLSRGNNDKGFGFALSAWFIAASVTGYVSGVYLILKCLCGGKWPLYTVVFGGLGIGVRQYPPPSQKVYNSITVNGACKWLAIKVKWPHIRTTVMSSVTTLGDRWILLNW